MGSGVGVTPFTRNIVSEKFPVDLVTKEKDLESNKFLFTEIEPYTLSSPVM